MAKMTVAFQRKVVQFLTLPGNRQYVGLLDVDCFDTEELRTAFEVIRAYVADYKAVPDEVSAVEYLHGEMTRHQVDPDTRARMASYLETLYDTAPKDGAELVKSRILDYAARKRGAEALRAALVRLGEDGAGLAAFKREADKINKLAKLDSQMIEAGERSSGFLLEDHFRRINDVKMGEPTFIKGLNRLMAAGGLRSPELAIIIASPKGFKTGTCLNFAVEYMREGKKVYYVDTENGWSAIKARAMQTILKCELKDLFKRVNIDRYARIVPRMAKMGGDMVIDYYDGGETTVADVEANLAVLKTQFNWVPDLIIWDYPDHLLPSRRVKEEHKAMSVVYADIINLNNRLGCFSIGISQVGRGAVDKPVFSMADIAGDFGKIMGCHAAFAICRTDTEVEAGIARMVPVVQRAGARYKHGNVVTLEMKEEIMHVAEITPEEAALRLAAVPQREDPNNKKKRIGAPRPSAARPEDIAKLDDN